MQKKENSDIFKKKDDNNKKGKCKPYINSYIMYKESKNIN